jgi:plastocyanin
MRSALAAACAVLILTAGCSGDDEDGRPAQPANTVVLDGQVANDHGTGTVTASGERVTLEAGDFYFEPTVLTGPAGEAVFLQVVSGGPSLHNLSAGEVDQDVASGQSMEVELTFPDSGTLVFACKYHRDRGMAGALVAT